MKKFALLSLMLVLAAAWGFAAADSVKRDIKAEETSNLISSQTDEAKASSQQWYSINPALETVVNEEVTDRRAGVELIKQAMTQEAYNKLRLHEITSDGIISEDEADEYADLCSNLPRPDFPPVVMNTVSETEPNNDCGTADTLALGDTVYCAYIDCFTDADDYFTFTLDSTYTSWLLDLEGISGDDCGSAPWSLFVTVFNSDCSEIIVPPNEWGYPHIIYPVAPGTYVIQCHVPFGFGNTGYYHLTLNAGEYVELPGDNCGNPLTINIPAALPYSDLNQTTCGRINNYDYRTGSCLGDYSTAEDIIYELNVTSANWYEFTLDPYWTTDIGLAVGTECQPVSCVLNKTTGEEGGIIDQVAFLEIGTYYMMIDCAYWGGSCIDSFNISIDIGSPPLDGEFCSWPITISNPLDYSDTRDLSLYDNDYRWNGKDVVYTFTLEEPEHLRFSTCESTDEFHTVLILYDSFSACGGYESIAYEEIEGCDLSEHVAFDYECEAGTYYLVVDSDIESYPEGSYTLVVEQFVPICNDPEYVPPNDSCHQVTPVAIAMSTTETFTGNACNSTQDNDYLSYPGVWVAFTTAEAGNLTLDFCNTVPTRHSCFKPLFTECLGEDHLSPYTVDYGSCPTSENPVLKYYNIPAGTYYYNVLNVGDPYWAEGPYSLDVTLEPFYEVDCPVGAIDEGENLCLGPEDVYNGGCRADEPHFQTIDSGAVICGYTGNPDDWTRDWDYFEYVATDFRRLEFKAVMEAPIYISIRDGSNGCDEENILIEATEGVLDTAYVSYEVTPGTYWMTVSVDADYGWQCPVDYVAFFDPIWIEPYYCDPCFVYSEEYISQVDFNAISNSTGSEGGPCYYGDYTNISTQVQQYGVYELSVQVVSNGSQEDVCAWIDWDQDYVFQEDESYYLGRGADFTPSIYILVPGDALLGQTRMRVITAQYNPWWPQPVNPCPVEAYNGEIEDYTVEVQAGLPAEFSVNPTTIDVEIDPRESATEVLTVSNTGDADLLFTADVWMDPPMPAERLSANIDDKRKGGSASIFDLDRNKPRSDIQPSEPGLILQGGDDISSAVPITGVPSTVAGTTAGYNDDYYEVCPLPNTGGLDVVYSYTPTEDEWITLNLCLGETNFDTRMYVYENAETPGDPYRCNEDACSSPVYENAYISRISDMPVYFGNTYYIVVDGFNQDAYGNYVLDVIYGTPQTGNEECADDGTLIYGQRPARIEEDWVYFTSDIEEDWINYENFGGAWGIISGITFWGADARRSGMWWEECDAASDDFAVTFYDEDENGEPGTVIYADTATVAGEVTGIYHDIFEEKRYSMDFDSPVCLVSGWISIQAISEPDMCQFMWISSPEGDGMSIEEDMRSSSRYLNDHDLAFCLHGIPMNWLTIDVAQEVVAPESSTAITVTLDAANLPGGSYRGSIRFETSDPANENVAVRVYLAVSGSGYEYLPGDVNMYNGVWPPAPVVGADATYLINFFRGFTTSHSCFINNPNAPVLWPNGQPGTYFWASADVNGDCQVIGADVTKLINYLRGSGTLSWCVEYEPVWHNAGELPAEAPAGWPNCESGE